MNKQFKKSIFVVLLISLLFTTTNLGTNIKIAKASTNLIDGGSFEGDIHDDWGFWNDSGSNRNYDFYRAYDASFGYGSYSAAIDAKKAPGDAFSAILSTSEGNSFQIDATQEYYLLFYAKATTKLSVIAYLQRTSDYNKISTPQAKTISNNWKRYMMKISPSASSESYLAFVLGDMPADSTLYLDGVQLLRADSALLTKNISGYIGEKNKFLSIRNISNFNENEIEVELPFYNNGKTARTRIHPEKMTSSGVYFTMPVKSFAGIGHVYVNDVFIGLFNYQPKIKINNIHPSLVRLNQDLIIDGSGFSSIDNSTFLIVDKINKENKREKVWLKPKSFDSNLSQMRFVLPPGVVSGSMFVQTSFLNTEGVETIIKSNSVGYKLKPIVVATNWSERGYEHVGDKLRIYGLGFGRSPMLKYYNENGELVDTIRAKFIESGDLEIIEAPTTKKTNYFNISVVSEGIESDQSADLSYLAKPVLSLIKTQYSRKMLASEQAIAAAKVGDTITLTGLSFQGSDAVVEFQGNNKRLIQNIAIESNKNTSLQVVVPEGALSGYIDIKVNGADSNYLPIEIIPTIISVNPDPVVPGETITITAYGVGDNVNLAKINFMLDSKIQSNLQVDSISINNGISTLRLKAPYDLSYKGTKISLQYDRWKDNGTTVLNIQPHIIRAGINMDNKILSIIGYGFSITPRENIISYKYSNEKQTVIDPNVRILGVYPTEEGQEIRIKILDDYHYGHVNIKVGEYTSNEVNFGPINIANISRRLEKTEGSAQVGVLYIKGYNFGLNGGVLVGNTWADIRHRSDFYIVAVVPEANLYDGPVIVARE